MLWRYGYGYAYDGHGQRVAKATITADGNWPYTFSAYSGTRLLLQDDTRRGTTRFIHLQDRLIAQQASDGAKVYLHADAHGSPRLATNQAGAVLWREFYQPWGARHHQQAHPEHYPLGYTAQAHDAETGLLYLGARYYHPSLGRFLAPDPVHVTDSPHSFNRYAYANNNPYRYSDPDGEHPAALAGAVLGLRMLADRAADALGRDSLVGGLLGALGEVSGGSAINEALAAAGAGDWGGAGLAALGAFDPGRKARGVATAVPALDSLSKAAAAADRNGFTKAGRSLQKHGSRPGSKWNQQDINVNDPRQANARAQDLVDDILTGPGGEVVSNPRGGWGVIAPDGRTARFNRDGSWQGFRE